MKIWNDVVWIRKSVRIGFSSLFKRAEELRNWIAAMDTVRKAQNKKTDNADQTKDQK